MAFSEDDETDKMKRLQVRILNGEIEQRRKEFENLIGSFGKKETENEDGDTDKLKPRLLRKLEEEYEKRWKRLEYSIVGFEKKETRNGKEYGETEVRLFEEELKKRKKELHYLIGGFGKKETGNEYGETNDRKRYLLRILEEECEKTGQQVENLLGGFGKKETENEKPQDSLLKDVWFYTEIGLRIGLDQTWPGSSLLVDALKATYYFYNKDYANASTCIISTALDYIISKIVGPITPWPTLDTIIKAISFAPQRNCKSSKDAIEAARKDNREAIVLSEMLEVPKLNILPRFTFLQIGFGNKMVSWVKRLEISPKCRPVVEISCPRFEVPKPEMMKQSILQTCQRQDQHIFKIRIGMNSLREFDKLII